MSTRLRWLVGALLAAGGVALLGVLLLGDSASPRPGPFYAVPSPLPKGPPGTLIRKELIVGLYPGAKSYRVLYKSTGSDGRPTAVSGLVVVPEGPAPAGGRKVIAFTHGIVGVARYCAPSLQRGDIGRVIDGLGVLLAAGYVVAASDYTGLGTPGRAPFLLGRVEAMNALDSVRAAHRLRQAHAGVEFAVWGSSQGGSASLFTGQLAPSYAPGLRLVGVAAGAPVTNVEEFFRVNARTPAGRVLLAMLVSSSQRILDDPRLEQVVAPAARPALAAVAGYCLYGAQVLGSVPSAAALMLAFAHHPRWSVPPWSEVRAAATPPAALAVPILITQGGADKVVPAHVTERFVRQLCAAGQRVDLRIYPSVEHREAGVLVAPDVAAWIAERFAGHAPPSSCG